MLNNIKSVFDSCVFWLVSVIKLKEILENLEVGEDTVVSQEVHKMLVVDTEFFFLIFLLVFHNEIVKKDFVQSIDVFLYQELDPFNGRFFILFQTNLLSVQFL